MALKTAFSKPQFKEDFVRKDDFVFSITAQITHKEIILPKLFLVNYAKMRTRRSLQYLNLL